MKKLRLFLPAIALVFVFGIPASAQLPPNTGQNLGLDSNNALRDTSYQITSDTTQEIGLLPAGNPPAAPSYLVVNGGGGWAIAAGLWIAPALDQSNATRPGTCCAGTVTYQMTFVALDGPNEYLPMYVYADDSVTVMLYNAAHQTGIQLSFDVPPSYSAPGIAYLCGPSYPAPQGSTEGCVNAYLYSGPTTLVFTVTNFSGPTGLNVSFTGTLGYPTIAGNDSTPAASSVTASPDPVDGASGQYYDTVDDLKLGGPLALGFSRYYSSALSMAGYASGLGRNWMSNFDVGVYVVSSTAKALLFGGKVVQFTNEIAGVPVPWQIQQPGPIDTVYQFAASGSGYKLMDPAAHLIYTFASSGALTRIEDRNGNAITVTPGPYGPTAISDGLGRTLTLTYTKGQLTKVQDQGGRTFAYTYNGGLLVSATDPFNNITKYTYLAGGLMVAKQLPLGNAPTTQAYNEYGRVISQTDANNNVTQIAYDNLYLANGFLFTDTTTITDPLGGITHQLNDNSFGGLYTLTDPAGGAANVTFESVAVPGGSEVTGRRKGVTDKSGHHTAFTWHDPTGYLASSTDALGNTKTNSYTAQVEGLFTFYNLTGISYADGTSATFSYDASGNPLTKTAQDGSVTKYTYDSSGHVLTIAAPAGVTTVFTWNADSTLATMTDALGNQTVYAYDALKRLSKKTDPNGAITGYHWDAPGQGHMNGTSGPSAAESETLYYDANGQPQRLVDSLGKVYAFGYTSNGQVASLTDPLANKTSYTYDAAQRTASITDPTGVVLTYAYDALSHVKSVSDPSGTRASYSYTADGYIASVSDGGGNQTSYSHDGLGRMVGLTTPAGDNYATAYDKRSRVIGGTDPLGAVQTLTRDANGNVIQVAAPGGLTTSIGRNALGNPTSLTSANGNQWTIGYDTANRLSQTADPLGNVTNLTYTGTELTQITLPLGTLTYTDNADGRATKSQYSDGTAINAGYDANGLLVSANNLSITRDAKGQPSNINGIAITLDGAGRPATLTYAAGKTIAYTYNSSGRLTAIADWVGGKTSLGYDAAGRLATLTYPNGVVTTYSYDANSRLVQIVFGSLGSIALTRDAAGKITAANRNVPLAPGVANLSSQQFSYDAAGQLTSATSDKMGRVTSQGSRTYTWNLASQLTAFNDGTNAAAFTYDGVGSMNTMTTGGTARSFVFNYLFGLPALAIVRQGGSDLRYYAYLPDGRLLYSIEANGARHYYHFDEMGNTVLLSGDTGAATDSYAITPYGDIADHSGTADNPFTWQGQYGAFQEGTALYNLRNRHYDASAARFVSRDPNLSADPRSSEPYAYGDGNPLLFVDPFGTCVNSPYTYCPQGASGPAVLQPGAGQTTCQKLGYCDASGAVINPNGIPIINVSLINQDGSSVVSNDGGSLISQDGSGIEFIESVLDVVSNDGGSISDLIGQDGSGLTSLFTELISEGGGGFSAFIANSIIGLNGSGLQAAVENLLSEGGYNMVGDNGAGLLNEGGYGIVGNANAGFVGNAGSSIRSPSKPRRGTGPAKPAK